MSQDLDLDGLRHVATTVAYRMVGSRTEAEDLAQEALVRVAMAAEQEELRSPEAFVTTVATRLSIDHLRLARVQREEYLGPWLPEPVSEALEDGAEAAEVADSLSFAMLSVLEALGPVERAAFLLREVFGYGYDEVAAVLDRSEPACRQIVARARARVEAGRPRRTVARDEHRRVLERFLAAARQGDVDGLVAVLAADAVMVSDGGRATKAARRPIQGRDRIVRFLRSIGPRALGPGRRVEIVDLNGEPGILALVDDEVVLAGTVEVADGCVVAVRWVLNPDKLRWVHAPWVREEGRGSA
ncbi:RNA polymerase sigma factor SigJ [Iamia sp. SCSIO 61187]|uniref:RNA polymerase sigma factor SigJ n=1 Tax=Iamia sp. SCSIO 61187 TaxID=2722752 RepID=UPI001C633AB0|nr:RNA polymerase sigma factor SigJ [Iamia sp. SCSIO 61187]QYG91700.1 RNA polymerase sigma factor SigJ [Iamia sp. SCSIO 61187]